MFGAMPLTAVPSSLKRRGPSSSASTMSSDQRSPTRSSAASSPDPDTGAMLASPTQPLQPLPADGNLQLASDYLNQTDLEQGLTMSMLDELGAQMASVAQKAGASVVRVGGGWRGGSGVVIGDGTVLTNAHNVRGDGTMVVFADGRQAEATLKGVDVDGDLAVLAVDTAGTPALSWAGTSASIGTPVFAAAAADGGTRVTFGFVSSVARAFRGPRG